MRVKSLGRMAVFYIPARHWESVSCMKGDCYVSDMVADFLISNYGGWNVRGPIVGEWRADKDSAAVREFVMEVHASFPGKGRIPKLHKFLAKLCEFMNEKCIYLETGEDAFLVYP